MDASDSYGPAREAGTCVYVWNTVLIGSAARVMWQNSLAQELDSLYSISPHAFGSPV